MRRSWSTLKKLIYSKMFINGSGGAEVWETASGSIVTFDAVAAPLRQLTVAVEPVQNLNGYDNPWPAGGGKNICPPIADGWVNGYIASDGSVNPDTTNGEKTSPFIKVGEELYYSFAYNLSGTPSSDYWSAIGWYDENNTFLQRNAENTGPTYTVRTAKAPSGAAYARVSFRTYNMANWVQFEQSFSFTSYSPYSNICPITGWDSVNIWVQPTHDTSANPTATIQLGETVYGGTLDVVNGKMTVDMAAVTISELSWTYNSTFGRMQTNGVRSVIEKPDGNDKRLKGLMCSAYTARPAINAGTQAINGTIAVATNGYIYILDEAYSDADAWKTAMGSQTIIYPLAEPQTYQLTPNEVKTLLGLNNIWADAGDMTVEYRAQ